MPFIHISFAQRSMKGAASPHLENFRGHCEFYLHENAIATVLKVAGRLAFLVAPVLSLDAAMASSVLTGTFTLGTEQLCGAPLDQLLVTTQLASAVPGASELVLAAGVAGIR